MGRFDAKVACAGCGKKVKRKKAVFRRGEEFCSQSCSDGWVNEHPFETPETPREQLVEDTLATLKLARAELETALIACGGTAETGAGEVDVEFAPEIVGQTAAAIRAVDALNTARDCVDEFETHVAKVLPLLHGIGDKLHATELDRCDLREVHRMSKLFAGGGQQKKVRRLLVPVLKTVRAAMKPLGG